MLKKKATRRWALRRFKDIFVRNIPFLLHFMKAHLIMNIFPNTFFLRVTKLYLHLCYLIAHFIAENVFFLKKK